MKVRLRSMRLSMHSPRHAIAALLFAAVAGCGGGGGGSPADATPLPPTRSFPPSAGLAAHCAVPRPGTDPFHGNRPYPDLQGSLDDEKRWVRSWIDETYLWYREVPDPPAAAYAGPVEYFNVLRTPATTASGNPRDRFHFVFDTTAWNQLSLAGVEAGYGIEWALLARSPPRRMVVANVDPGSPAANAGIVRGAEVVSVDGVDFVNGADAAAINAGAFPDRAGKQTIFVFRDPGATAPRTVTLAAIAVTKVPVQDVRTVDTPAGRVGYLLFTDHIATAEGALAEAVGQLRDAGASELVLDMRYNGGGFLDIAAELAYMIAGPERTAGRVFERLRFNDRNPFGYDPAGLVTPFHATTQGFSIAAGTALPTLSLARVTVLTSSGTCSASESVINALRGVDVEVNLVGGTTCGKPYGFLPQDNCGTTYFAIQFEGLNDRDFGDYADGFAPTCTVADDFTRPLGDPAEGRFAAALELLATGACPAGTATTAKSLLRDPELVRSPARENRILRR
ncbi:MAG TPA: S41 family peptidase [Usitatibacteraceae bacterium]|nr:S41 family peptidase [Usitatibacteraceae bacterium]